MVSRVSEQGRSEVMPFASGRPTSPLKVLIEPEDNPIEQAAEALAGFDIACRYLFYALDDSIEFSVERLPKRVQDAFELARKYAEDMSQCISLPPFTATGPTQDRPQELHQQYQDGLLTVQEYTRLVAEETAQATREAAHNAWLPSVLGLPDAFEK